MREKINQLGLIITILTIGYGSLTAGTPVSAGGLPLHFIAYFVLASAFLVNFHDTKRGHLEAMIASGTVALGLELIQFFLAFRTFSLIDFAVSFAGASLITLDHHLGTVTRFIELEDRILEEFFLS